MPIRRRFPATRQSWREGAPVSEPARLKRLRHAGSETGVPAARQCAVSKSRAFLAGLLVREQESELSILHPPSAILVGCGTAAPCQHRVSRPVLGTVPSWHTFAPAEGVREGRNHGTCLLERTGRMVSSRQPGPEHGPGDRRDDGPGGELVPGWDAGGAKRAENLGETIDFMPVASPGGLPLGLSRISL
jgi:hypothetical protein